MQKPKVILPSEDIGFHNQDLDSSRKRLIKSKAYADLSTIIICPTRGVIPARVTSSMISLGKPMNQKVIGPIFIEKMEVGEAYEHAISLILNNPDLSKFKYILTIEEDNLPPADGLIKLLETISQGDYDGVGGLYWTKGEGGMPMIYGNPKEFPLSFKPILPIPDSIQACNGIAMGFSIFKMEMFTSGKIERPFFKTCNDYAAGKIYTQDLYFCEKALKAGYRFAVDTRVKVGHFDYENDIVW
jgi:hypothetical protein